MSGKIEINISTLEQIKNFEYEQLGNIKFTSIIILLKKTAGKIQLFFHRLFSQRAKFLVKHWE
jgi:hypothetical protein